MATAYKLKYTAEEVERLLGSVGSPYAGVERSAGGHNSLFRSNDVTEIYTSGEFKKAVEAATFDDLFPGDYIVGPVSGRKYYLGHMDYRLHCGDTELTAHHVLMFPELSFYTAQMNTSNIVTGAYIGSAMYKSNLADAKSIIKNDFGDDVVAHRSYFANAVSGGYQTAGSWYDSEVELMNEPMVYGGYAFANQPQGTNYAYYHTIDKSQLAIFRLAPELIVCFNDAGSRVAWWLRDVASSAGFAFVGSSGLLISGGASDACGVRPAFLLC